MNRIHHFDRTSLAICLAALGGAVLYPIAMLAVEALGQWDWAILQDPGPIEDTTPSETVTVTRE